MLIDQSATSFLYRCVLTLYLYNGSQPSMGTHTTFCAFDCYREKQVKGLHEGPWAGLVFKIEERVNAQKATQHRVRRID